MTKTADRLGVGSEGTASSAGRETTWFAGRHAEIGVSDRGVPLVSHKLAGQLNLGTIRRSSQSQQ